MSTLATSLCLCIVIMTKVVAYDISEDLDIPPLSEYLVLFDVISDACGDEVKGAFMRSGLQLRHSFKVAGEERYVFVALVDDANTLRQLKFPKGSRVTQSPLEHVSDFLKMFDTENDWSESNSGNFSVDWVVTMDEYTFSIPENTPTEDFVALMANYSSELAKTHSVTSNRVATYAIIAAYPPKLLYFHMVEANKLQHIVLDSLHLFGGPGNTRRVGKYLVVI